MQTRPRNLPAFVAADGSVIAATAPMPDVGTDIESIPAPTEYPSVALAGTGWITPHREDLGRPAAGDQIVAFTGPLYIEHGTRSRLSDPAGPDGPHEGAFQVAFYAGIGSVVALGSFADGDAQDLVRVMYMTRSGPVPVGAAVAAQFIEATPPELRDAQPKQLLPGLPPLAYASEQQRVARAERINATHRLADTLATRAHVQGTSVVSETDVLAAAEITRFVETRQRANQERAAIRENMLARARGRRL